MLTQIRRSGNSYVVRIPREEMERIGVDVDDYVQVDLHAVDVIPRLPADLEASVRTRLAQPEVAEAFRLLADA